MATINQGSRATLVTWTVVMTIAFFVSLGFTIYFYTAADAAEKKAAQTSSQYNDVIPVSQLTELESLKASRKDTSEPLWNFVLGQRGDIAKLLAGTTNSDPAKATTAFKTSLTGATAKMKAAGDNASLGDSAAAAITALATKVESQHAEILRLTAEKAAAVAERDAKVKEVATVTKSHEDDLEKVRTDAVAAQTTLQGLNDQQNVKYQEVEGGAKTQLDAQLAELQRMKTELADKEQQIADLGSRIKTATNKLNATRIDTSKPIASAVDGQILRLSQGNTVYINLGSSDQIAPGMTFEVYDKLEGIPPLTNTDNNENLPLGKGAIEVIRIGPTSSECRVVRTTRGRALTEGDLIANLVYDKNIKYKLVVYGNFNLDQSARFTPEEGKRDAEVVKRLITQWGGTVVDAINVDTDFLILGVEPQIPVFTQEELRDAINKSRFDAAKDAADAYEAIKAKAIDLHIPILNQNRFLYMVGYYEQAKR